MPQTPTITSSASGTVEDGSSFSLTCQTASTGITSAMYIWSIGGVDQAAQSSNTLVQTADINNVVAYTCKVSADGGTDYSAATTSSFSHPGKFMAMFRVCACHLWCLRSEGHSITVKVGWWFVLREVWPWVHCWPEAMPRSGF